MSALRLRIGAAIVALAPATMTAGGAGCGATELQTNEPTAQEREVTTAALLDQLSLEGALLDESPSDRLLATTSPMPMSTRIAAPRAAVPRPLDEILRAWGVEIPASCATVQGVQPDADDDGIPAIASVHLECAAAAYDVAGTAFVIDDSDQDPASGFALGLQDLRVQSSTTGASISRRADASFLVIVRPDPSPGAVDTKVDVRVDSTRTASNGASTEASFESSGTTTYFPDKDLTPTTRSQHGSVTSSVHTKITYGGVAHTWTRRSALSLHWSASCKTVGSTLPGFDGGGVLYADERGNALRFDFTSCAKWTVTLNGRP